MLKKTSFLICSLAIAFTLTACNTTKGVGEDIEAGGEAIQRAAQ
ncbi:entericidin A/B family lipoprotein [Providencia vermicola]|nr:entericidin A/B family lipoprotein [Providencia stuartii]